jgi:hypothetical protein
MPDWYSHYIYLILGVIFFSGAVVSTCTGRTRTRFRRAVYRANEPSEFWGQSQCTILPRFVLSDTSCISSMHLQTESISALRS